MAMEPAAMVLAAICLLLGTLCFLVYFSLPVRRKFVFKGKHALVTGGSKGIGRQLAVALIRRGCNVSIVARQSGALAEAVGELNALAESLGSQATAKGYVLDVSESYETTESVIRRAEEGFGTIEILINNAGVSVQDAFEELPVTDFEREIRTNYLSAVWATRAVIEKMKRNRSGHIGFVSSAAGQIGIWGYTAYSPSKFAIRGFAESLHMELLPFNISVSVLYPPNTITEGFHKEIESMPEVLKKISGSGGLFEPKRVAESAVADIAMGNFSTSIGFEGTMLGALTAGGAPEKSFCRATLQVLFGGIMRGIMLVYVGYFNWIVSRSYPRSG